MGRVDVERSTWTRKTRESKNPCRKLWEERENVKCVGLTPPKVDFPEAQSSSPPKEDPGSRSRHKRMSLARENTCVR